ncbi:Cys-tRNA(Pro) deacylase [Alkaliphilus hydrothermalis]|uniref:Cys-tRNA(Pro)/Cys-tRNA(Cys) deacylase n=1 Tax=Alkaliphilus hydrothermalis TaxID=1482730 RepID=A0ABS2NRQ5_9FIRM|nr:Cys-tRNA(Pro) deacylase [Alkaliphilus hydrothermalis]MBM7615633.1 Cys-tRNA(Pro)/Cys-tRNA(Cys) deacylase [Alkaliphilus hydrothermalis]
MKKTNAARILDKHKIQYEMIEYEVDENDLSAENVANKLNMPLNQIFKTLVARGDKTGVLVACVPGGDELNLKSLANLSGNKKVEMVPLKEIQQLTGYIRGGCSPIGMKKNYPTFIDESALAFSQLTISAGMRGQQLSLAPEDLISVTKAQVGPITVAC